jgi:hypothetical protein
MTHAHAIQSFAIVMLASATVTAQGIHGRFDYPCGYALPIQPIHLRYHEPHHSSTAAGDYARAYARVVEAYGQAQLFAYQGQVYKQHARAIARENALRQVEEKLRLREAYKACRVAEAAARRLSREQLTRIARDAAARPLTSSDLSFNGELRFPTLLLLEELQVERSWLNELVRRRAQGSYVDPRQVEMAADQLILVLKRHVHVADPREYVAAKNFVRSVKRYARTSAAITPLAAK